MRKWAVRIGILVSMMLLILFAAAFWSDSDTAVLTGYRSNPDARLIRPDWQGTPLDQRSRFMNHEFPFLPKTRELLKWQTSSNPFKTEKENDSYRPKVFDPAQFFDGKIDGVLWLGHASFYIRIKGRSILIDPVFGQPNFITRYTEVPSPLEMIPTVDYVLLTHDHRDHMDERTLRAIAQRFPEAKFLAGMGSEELLSEWITPENVVSTVAWFQEFPLNDRNVQIYFLPVRHWSRRGLFDTNQRLWGGYVIEGGETTIYHGGDSGYGRHYKETGELFPEIDVFLIGIGAYEPRWFMEANHNNPADVMKAFKDSGAKTLVPMHYGTFDLSDEPPGAPLAELRRVAESEGLTDRIKTLNIFESLPLP